jgi:hypothetical protein
MENNSELSVFANGFDRFNELDHFEDALYGCGSKA